MRGATAKKLRRVANWDGHEKGLGFAAKKGPETWWQKVLYWIARHLRWQWLHDRVVNIVWISPQAETTSVARANYRRLKKRWKQMPRWERDFYSRRMSKDWGKDR